MSIDKMRERRNYLRELRHDITTELDGLDREIRAIARRQAALDIAVLLANPLRSIDR